MRRCATNRLSVVEIVGEAGIGKTTLLEHLGASARTAGALVLSARLLRVRARRAVRAADRRARRATSPARRAGLARRELDGARRRRSRRCAAHAGPPVERHELHRAVRALLERLAAPRGLDAPARRPALGRPGLDRARRLDRAPPVLPRLLLALAHRHRQADSALGPRAAPRRRRGPRAPLDARAADARPRLPACSRAPPTTASCAGCTRRAAATRSTSCSSARTEHPARCPRRRSRPRRGAGGRARGGAERDHAAAAPTRGRCWTARRSSATRSRSTSPPRSRGSRRAAALEALDVLVAADLVRVTEDVRRFRFRHPIVRRTVYETVGPGRRLAGHARAAAGAGARRRRAGRARPSRRAVRRARRRRGRRGAGRGGGRRSPARAPQTAVHWLTVARTLARGPQEGALLGPLARRAGGCRPLRRRAPRAARAARPAARGRAGAAGADRRPAR